MYKRRLIPILFFKNGWIVRSEEFKIHQIIGNPINEVERFNQWNVDELIYLDISSDNKYDLRRNDSKVKNLNDPLDILDEVSKHCMMPLTWGGKIKTIEDISLRMKKGADKVSINSAAFRDKNLIFQAAREFGSQAIVVNIDVYCNEKNEYIVVIDGGKTRTDINPVEWAKTVERLGAGEILLQSINRDGVGEGYDLKLISKVAQEVSIPIICLGGVGEFTHFSDGIKSGASAVAAANLWHFKEMADRLGKKALKEAGIDVRILS